MKKDIGIAARRPRRLGSEDGSVMIETAMAFLVIVPLVFWLFELCMLTYTVGVLRNAAREGVRYAIDHGTGSSICSGPSQGCGDPSGENVISVVRRSAAYSFHDLSDMQVKVTYPDASSAPPSRVAVAIDYTYVPYVQLPGIAQDIQIQSQGRIVY